MVYSDRLAAAYMMVYAEKDRRKDPKNSVIYETDAYFRDRIGQTTEVRKAVHPRTQA